MKEIKKASSFEFEAFGVPGTGIEPVLPLRETGF